MIFERESGKPFEIEIPLKFDESLLPEFTEFTRKFLDNLHDDPEKRTAFIRIESSEEESVFKFAYKSAFTHAGAFYTSNTMVASVGAKGECNVHVYVSGDAYRAYEVGSLVRQLAMEWSNREKN